MSHRRSAALTMRLTTRLIAPLCAATLAAVAIGAAQAADSRVPPPPQLVDPAAALAPAAPTATTNQAPATAAAMAIDKPAEKPTQKPVDRAAPQPANTSRVDAAGVRTTVIEDRGARIEEQKLRGSVRSIHVAPKGVGAPYEVLPATGPGGPRDDLKGPGSAHTSAGQRVWSIFSF